VDEIGNEKKLDEFIRPSSPERKPEKYTKKAPLFQWTGHPFVDAGLVALLLISKKDSPEELTEEDVKKAVDFVSELYARKEWSSG